MSATYQVPDQLRYTRDHEWIRVEEKDGVLWGIVGITDYAQQQLGDIVYVDVPTVQQELQQFDTFGTVEAVKTVADLYMPVSGVVEESNPDVQEAPQLINEDPYGKGWIIRIRISNPDELNALLTADAYRSLISTDSESS